MEIIDKVMELFHTALVCVSLVPVVWLVVLAKICIEHRSH